MKFYFLIDEHRYVHRQSDIPKGALNEVRDIPVDLSGLMSHLNYLHKQIASWKDLAERSPEQFDRDQVVVTAPDEEVPIEAPPEPEPPKPPMNAVALLSRVDSPGVNVEGVIEAIGAARGYALSRYAGAVAIRFQELEKI